MPYIKQCYRNTVDQHLTQLIAYINNVPEEQDAGVLNYCVSRLLNGLVAPYNSAEEEMPIWNYDRINKVMGVLSCVKSEFYRRIAVPYEIKKIQENGDILEYQLCEQSEP